MRALNLLLSVMLVSPASIALAANSADTSTKTTDSAGTTTTTETSRDELVGKSGVAKTTQDVNTVVDPKGLMNKTTAKMHAEREVTPGGDFSESKIVKHADGTAEEISAEKVTSDHWTNKGKTTTTTHTRVVDPKGLGNKAEVEEKEIVETNPDGTVKRTVTEEVNGDTVSEETKVTH